VQISASAFGEKSFGMISLHPLHCQEDFALLLAEKTLKRQNRPLRGSYRARKETSRRPSFSLIQQLFD
jgi:hypothetical protein